MTMSRIRISISSPAHPSTFPYLAKLYYKSFSPSQIHHEIFTGSSASSIEDHVLQQFLAEQYSAKITVARLEGQETIVGFALWRSPASDEDVKLARDRKKSVPWPAGTNLALVAEFYGAATARNGTVTGRHYYLSKLTVDPDYQKLGIGAAMLKDGLDEADKEGVKVHLNSTIEALPLYEKFGFLPFGEPVVAVGRQDLKFIPMYRPPRSPSTPELTLLHLSNLPPSLLTHYSARFAEIHHAAFSSGELFRSLFSLVNPDDFVAIGKRRFSRAIERSEKDGVAVVLALLGEEVVGVAYWALPKHGNQDPSDASEQEPSPEREFAPGSNLSLAKEFFGQLDAHTANKSLPPHYELFILATSPALQRTGAGTALINWGIERAENEAVDVRLDATKEALEYYPRFGFERYGDILEASDESFRLYPMVRNKRPNNT